MFSSLSNLNKMCLCLKPNTELMQRKAKLLRRSLAGGRWEARPEGFSGTSKTLGSEPAGSPWPASVGPGFLLLLESRVSVLKSKVTMTQLVEQHNPLGGSKGTFPTFISNCKSKRTPTYFLEANLQQPSNFKRI